MNANRILVAERDVKIFKQIKDYFELNECEVLPVVKNGDDLIENAISLNPSLIIADVDLNGQLDGIEVMDRLKNIKKTPYILIMGSDDRKSLIDSYFLKPLDLIIKPIKKSHLVKSLRKAVNNLGYKS